MALNTPAFYREARLFPSARTGIYIFTTLVLLVLAHPVSALAMGARPQDTPDVFMPGKSDPNALLMVQVNNTYGAVNGKGEIVIKPQFEACDYIPGEKIALVKFNGKWGIQDMRGQWIARPQFDEIGGYNSGLAIAKQGTLWGYIDAGGQWKIKPVYDFAAPFGAEKLTFVVRTPNKGGFIDASGVWRADVSQGVFADSFGNGTLATAYKDSDGKEKKKVYGFLDERGAWAIEPRYEAAFPFAANGLALVKQNDLFGYIDAKGQWAIPPKYRAANSFDAGGMALVSEEENGRYGFINEKGEWVVTPKFTLTQNDNIQYVLRNQVNQQLYYFASNGLARAHDKGKYGFIDKKGEWVIPPQFDTAFDFADNGLALIRKGAERQYIDNIGMPVLTVKKVCGTEVIQNSDGTLVWPVGKSIAAICQEQEEVRKYAATEAAAKQKADAEAKAQAEATEQAREQAEKTARAKAFKAAGNLTQEEMDNLRRYAAKLEADHHSREAAEQARRTAEFNRRRREACSRLYEGYEYSPSFGVNYRIERVLDDGVVVRNTFTNRVENWNCLHAVEYLRVR